MTRLTDLKETMVIKNNNMCMGEVWYNQDIDMLFDGVKSNKFNLELLTWVRENLKDSQGKITMHSRDNFTKTQLKKINAICKAKTKETLQKRVYALSDLFTNSYYSRIFNKERNTSWVNFCTEHKLKHGLVKVNRIDEYNKELMNMLG